MGSPRVLGSVSDLFVSENNRSRRKPRGNNFIIYPYGGYWTVVNAPKSVGTKNQKVKMRFIRKIITSG